jgi:four helix bundle protein
MMFEDLEAWQQARQLVNEIYSLTGDNSSLSKDFGLAAQVQRAAVSIMSNVWACEVL